MPSNKSISGDTGVYGEETGIQVDCEGSDFGAVSLFKSAALQAAPKPTLAHTSMLHAARSNLAGMKTQSFSRLSPAARGIMTTMANPNALPPIVDDGSGTADGSDGSSASGNGGSAAPSADAPGDASDDGYDDSEDDSGTDDGGGDAYSDDGSSGDDFDDGSDWSA